MQLVCVCRLVVHTSLLNEYREGGTFGEKFNVTQRKVLLRIRFQQAETLQSKTM